MEPEIDATRLADYLHYGYINAPRSIYRDVFKLEPGHWLELKQGGEPVTAGTGASLDALHEPLQGHATISSPRSSKR